MESILLEPNPIDCINGSKVYFYTLLYNLVRNYNLDFLLRQKVAPGLDWDMDWIDSVDVQMYPSSAP